MASDTIEELFETYPNTKLELVCLTDFNFTQDPYCFRAVFKFINEYGYPTYPTANIPVELFHKKYKIGSRFYNGRQTGYGKGVVVSSFEIDTTNGLQEYKIRDCISVDDNQLIENDYMNQFFLEQNCYYLSYDDYDLIIPHYAISNHFHFQSSSLKHAILENTFEYLYYQYSFKRDTINPNKVKLKIKSKANQSDLKTICNFLDNEYAFSTFKSYIGQRAKCKNRLGLCQIKGRFPIFGKFNIKTLSKQINKKGKAKIIVLGIYQDDYEYSFNEIDYEIDKAVNINSINIKKDIFVKEKPKVDSGKVVNKIPNAKYIISNEVFIEMDFNDINEIRLNPIYVGIDSNKPLVLDEVEKMVDGSYKQARYNGDENTQQKSISSTTGSTGVKKELEIFPIEKFDTLFNNLIAHKDVISSFISNKIPLIPRGDSNGRVPSKYYIISDLPRCYKYGNFIYQNNKIAFIEIEAGGTWKKSTTWFFILNDINDCFDENEVNEIIFQYIGTKSTLEDIETILYKEQGIVFFRKKHPDIELNEKNIHDWVKGVLINIVRYIQ